MNFFINKYMNKKLTLDEYNDTLYYYDLMCCSNDEFIDKRKTYQYICKKCQAVFNNTVNKLSKDCKCPNYRNHYIPKTVPENMTVQLYAKSLPEHIKGKDRIYTLNDRARYKCYLCKHIFKTTAREFIINDYKCPFCNN